MSGTILVHSKAQRREAMRHPTLNSNASTSTGQEKKTDCLKIGQTVKQNIGQTHSLHNNERLVTATIGPPISIEATESKDNKADQGECPGAVRISL